MCAASLAWKIFVKYASLNHYLKTCLEPSLEAFQQLMPLVISPSHANITISRLLSHNQPWVFLFAVWKTKQHAKDTKWKCSVLFAINLSFSFHGLPFVRMRVCLREKREDMWENVNSVLAAFLRNRLDSNDCFVVTRATAVAKCSKSIRGKKSEISGRRTFCYFLRWWLVLIKSRESLINDKRYSEMCFYMLLLKAAS